MHQRHVRISVTATEIQILKYIHFTQITCYFFTTRCGHHSVFTSNLHMCVSKQYLRKRVSLICIYHITCYDIFLSSQFQTGCVAYKFLVNSVLIQKYHYKKYVAIVTQHRCIPISCRYLKNVNGVDLKRSWISSKQLNSHAHCISHPQATHRSFYTQCASFCVFTYDITIQYMTNSTLLDICREQTLLTSIIHCESAITEVN